MATLFLAAACVAHAHPHMWIDTAVGYRFGPTGLAGFTVAWTFDELNSATMLELSDADRNGSISPQESETARKDSFEHLYDLGYFLLLEVNGAARKPERATEFAASIENRRLVYRFFVPLSLAASGGWATVALSVVDEAYYVDFRVPEGAVTAAPPQGLEAKVRRVEKPRTFASGWTAKVQRVELDLRRKPA